MKDKVRFYNGEQLARKLKISGETFHLEVKKNILRQFRVEIENELRVNNPDIGLDELDMVYLGTLDHKRVISTNLSIFDFI